MDEVQDMLALAIDSVNRMTKHKRALVSGAQRP